MHFFKSQIRKLRGEPELTDDLVARMMHRLVVTNDEEISCDEVFALVDEYAEASHRGEDVASLKPLIRHHLEMCRECDEEFQALLRVLEGGNSN
jgi:phosphoglycolate phosphatase-like HAD superfamily hydrolase